MNEDNLKPEDFAVYRCRTCKDILYSKYPGHFSRCKCGNFVDQTEYYMRQGGNFDDFEYLGTVNEVINNV